MSEEATLDEFVNDESDSETSEEDLLTSLDETSVGNIPSEWSAVRLSELTKDTLYGANESAEDYDPDKPRYIRIKDIDDRGRLKESEKASLSTDKAEGYLLEEGDMLFARSGSPGRTYLHRYDEGKYCYGGYSIKHGLISEGLNHEYLSQYTKSQKYWDWIERIARTGAQANINSGEYASLLVPLPSLPEQRRIATVLYTVDRAIEKTERVIGHYENLQTGLLRKHFGKASVQVDYSDDRETKRLGPKSYTVPKDWETVQISDVGKVVTGDTPSTKNEDYYGGDLPFVTPEDFGEAKRVYRGSRGLTDEGRQKSRPIPEDAVMMDCIGIDMGKVRIAGRELATNQQINSIVVNTEKVLPEFLYFHLKAISNLIQSQAGQTRTPIVSKSQFSSFEIFKPPISAQEDVVNSLSVFDKLIEKESEYVAQLRRLKRGLMQDLLSGTVRITDTNIEVPEEIAQYG